MSAAGERSAKPLISDRRARLGDEITEASERLKAWSNVNIL